MKSVLILVALLFGFHAVSVSLAELFPRGQRFVHMYDWYFGLALLLVIVFTWKGVALPLSSGLNRFARWLSARGAFTSDAVREAPKFALIRIVFGVFLFDRVMAIAVRMPATDWADTQVVLPVVLVTILSIMLTVGFATQLVLVAFIVWDWQLFEYWMASRTLGNDIASMLALLLLLTNAGAHFSVDGWLRKKAGAIGAAVRYTYFEDGIAPNNVVQIAKFVTLGSYWLVCVFSLMMHLSETAWMTGSAGPHLLTNQFMSRYGDEFTYLFQVGGTPAVWLARVSLWVMLPWYLLVLPGVLMGRWMRAYIIGWGILFFCLSRFVLQLGWLADFEFLFWIGLFLSPRLLGSQDDLAVAYDDRCSLCDRTVNFIRRLDLFGRIELRPVSQNHEWLQERGISATDALTDLYGVEATSGEINSGYDFYVRLTRKLFLLWPVYPVLLLGRFLKVGPMVYRVIADRRTKLFGVCQMATPKPNVRVKSNISADRDIGFGNPLLPLVVHWSFFAIAFLWHIPAPFVGHDGMPAPFGKDKDFKHIVNAAHIYGIAPINVFNQTDLRMTENWFTLSQEGDNGERELLPVFNEKGQRLGLHRSDRLYFGHTVPFRRKTIDKEGCHFEQWSAQMAFLASHSFSQDAVPDEIVYTQYFQALVPNEDVFRGNFYPETPRIICQVTFDPNQWLGGGDNGV